MCASISASDIWPPSVILSSAPSAPSALGQFAADVRDRLGHRLLPERREVRELVRHGELVGERLDGGGFFGRQRGEDRVQMRGGGRCWRAARRLDRLLARRALAAPRPQGRTQGGDVPEQRVDLRAEPLHDRRGDLGPAPLRHRHDLDHLNLVIFLVVLLVIGLVLVRRAALGVGGRPGGPDLGGDRHDERHARGEPHIAGRANDSGHRIRDERKLRDVDPGEICDLLLRLDERIDKRRGGVCLRGDRERRGHGRLRRALGVHAHITRLHIE
jgi:hypothetical protein